MSEGARKVLSISGTDRVNFLQGLVTNDAVPERLVYSALLTPQGKYIADFFLLEREADILVDVDGTLADALVARLSMYKLRADVSIENSDLSVSNGTGEAPEGAFIDPREPRLGWRHYHSGPTTTQDITVQRVENCVPETGIELSPDTYILEAGFERLHGVDFKKGCYVGQEVTARMKHKTELRKGLVTVSVSAEVPQGTPITREGKNVGVLYSQAKGQGIAYLRFDRASDELQAGLATVIYSKS